jgi:hypothetical protein
MVSPAGAVAGGGALMAYPEPTLEPGHANVPGGWGALGQTPPGQVVAETRAGCSAAPATSSARAAPKVAAREVRVDCDAIKHGPAGLRSPLGDQAARSIARISNCREPRGTRRAVSARLHPHASGFGALGWRTSDAPSWAEKFARPAELKRNDIRIFTLALVTKYKQVTSDKRQSRSQRTTPCRKMSKRMSTSKRKKWPYRRFAGMT